MFEILARPGGMRDRACEPRKPPTFPPTPADGKAEANGKTADSPTDGESTADERP